MLADLPPGSHVLDAACGIGLDVAALARRGHHVVGADASPAMLEEAARRTDAELVCCTWNELPTRVPGPFDAVLCVGNSLPHLPTSDDRRTALIAFAAVLAPTGRLVLDSHDWEVVHAQGSGRLQVGARRYEWHVAERFGEPYVLTITLSEGDRTAVHAVVSHPFTREDLLADLAAAGLTVDELVAVPGDERYTVIARRD